MKNEKITTFLKFNKVHETKKMIANETKQNNRLVEITNSYHESQLKLQELQREYIGTAKENKTEREELKKAIIEQTKVVKQKEGEFKKALGNEDITDLEI
jgi:predicted HAD superfamily Cof-like phosphohydrolase